jgi:hypothetical protein
MKYLLLILSTFPFKELFATSRTETLTFVNPIWNIPAILDPE